MGWITRQEVLVIVLGRVESPAGLDPCDDRSIKHACLVELGDIALGNVRLLRMVGKITERY